MSEHEKQQQEITFLKRLTEDEKRALNTAKEFQCLKCGWVGRDASDTRRHIRTIHLQERTFPCTQCLSKFSTKAKLVRHEMSVHVTKDKADVRNFSCHLCSKTFRHQDTLASHLKDVHLQVKPFVCTFLNCSRRFARQSFLDRHVRTHTNERPYECMYCHQTFKRSDHLIAHQENNNGQACIKVQEKKREKEKEQEKSNNVSLPVPISSIPQTESNKWVSPTTLLAPTALMLPSSSFDAVPDIIHHANQKMRVWMQTQNHHSEIGETQLISETKKNL